MAKVFYHTDMDGFAAAEIVRRAHPNVDMIGANYNQDVPFHRLFQHEEIYVVDMTFKPEQMDKLNRDYRLKWIDHHENVIKEAEKRGFNPEGLRSTEGSACLLTWKYLFPNTKIPFTVQMISDNDTWTKQIPEAEDFVRGLGMMNIRPSRQNNWLWDNVLNDNRDLIASSINRSKAVSKFADCLHRTMMDDLSYEFITHVDGVKCKVITANARSTSVMFNPIIETEKPDFLMNYAWIGYAHRYRFGVYSVNKDIDVSKFARENGGDGNPGASGFESSKMPLIHTNPHDNRREYLLQGCRPNKEPCDLSYLDELNEHINSNVIVKSYIKTNEQIAINSQSFETKLNGLSTLAINYPFARPEMFFERRNAIEQELLVSFVWTNCGNYRIVVYPVLESTNVDFLKTEYNAERIGKLGWWFYTKRLPLEPM